MLCMPYLIIMFCTLCSTPDNFCMSKGELRALSVVEVLEGLKCYVNDVVCLTEASILFQHHLTLLDSTIDTLASLNQLKIFVQHCVGLTMLALFEQVFKSKILEFILTGYLTSVIMTTMFDTSKTRHNCLQVWSNENKNLFSA